MGALIFAEWARDENQEILDRLGLIGLSGSAA
jgi:hypothetical protein